MCNGNEEMTSQMTPLRLCVWDVQKNQARSQSQTIANDVMKSCSKRPSQNFRKLRSGQVWGHTPSKNSEIPDIITFLVMLNALPSQARKISEIFRTSLKVSKISRLHGWFSCSGTSEYFDTVPRILWTGYRFSVLREVFLKPTFPCVMQNDGQ